MFAKNREEGVNVEAVPMACSLLASFKVKEQKNIYA